MDIDSIIERLRQVHGAKNDSQLTQMLNLGKSATSNWRFRKYVPVDICFETACSKGVSMDWILFGIGGMRLGGQGGTSDVVGVPAAGTESNPAADRLSQFVYWWCATRSQHEMIWLEQQFKRAVPEYAEWTETPAQARD